MWIVRGKQTASSYEQIFQTFEEANSKAKWLAGLGYEARVERV